jgi:hypothetical protein
MGEAMGRGVYTHYTRSGATRLDSGRPGNTMFEALASVREAVAVADEKREPLCILTLDFRNAFDRISHQYLFAILHSYCISNSFVDRIRNMYTDSLSMVQVNGHLSAPFPINAQSARGARSV